MPQLTTKPRTPPQTLTALLAGELQGATTLDLRGCGLQALPSEVLSLADTLQSLDVSGNALDALPDGLALCTRLHTLFASNNRYTQLPPVLGKLPQLDTLGFKANQIVEVPARSLSPTLRWLILTDNRIVELPSTLADCGRMQKLMLAGNRLTRLPPGLGRLQRLELLRLSANHFERAADALPDELLALPRLAWLAHAGNPFSLNLEQRARAVSAAPPISWRELHLQALLGEGASGHIHAARWQPPQGPALDVAVKLFKGSVTSDGLPQSEMAAMQAAGAHAGLLGALGVLAGHPEGRQGLVLPRLASHWVPLAGPPSMASCSRDVYPEGWHLKPGHAAAIARTATDALDHLHARGLTHGDVYGHNLLVDGRGGAVLSDFGAASFLPLDDTGLSKALRVLDRRALQVLCDELATALEH
jgi:hypothetical protein